MFWHVSFNPSVCPHLGGYPYSIMLWNITQNAMGKTPGGVPISHNALQHYPECHGADTGGGSTWPDPARGVPSQGGILPGGRGYPARGYPVGGTLPGGTLLGGYPGRVPPRARMEGYPAGGYPGRGYPAGGYLGRVPPRPGRGVPCLGGTQVDTSRQDLDLYPQNHVTCLG